MSVPIRDDAVEDDGETFTLLLSNVSGAGVANDDYEAVGTIRNDETEAPSGGLTASFEGLPAEHRGEGGFHFRVAFSEDIGISFQALREDAFAVTGGRVTGGSRVDGRRDLFKMTVRPDSDAAVTITLPAGRECGVSGAICTKGKNRRKLTNTITATVAGPSDERTTNTPATGAPTIGGTPQVWEELTASTSGIADADGLDDARFAYQWLRNDTDIQGATAPTYTAVDADAGKRLKVRVSFTDDAGNAENLTSAATDAVAARPEPLTARFEGLPAKHRGEGGFHFRVAFSEDIGISFRSLREDAFTVTGGRVTGGTRVDGRRDLFRMTVRPDSDGDVTITLPAGRECGVSGAVCTKGEPRRPLTNSPSATVAGPVGIAVADARVEEGAGAVLAFAVTLSRAASGERHADGELCHLGRHGHGGHRLHGGERHADLHGRRVVEDDRGDGARRLPRRGRGDADADAVESLVGPGDPRRGHRDDREPRPAAAGAAGTVRADGGGARGRARRGAAGGAARAWHRGPRRGPGAAAGHGARAGAERPEPARGLGRRASARRRTTGRLAGWRHGVARDADGRGGRADDGRRVRAGRRAQRQRTPPDGPRGRGSADRLGVCDEPGDEPRRHPLVLEPGGAVVLRGPRGRAVARRGRADDDGRGRLREGAAGGGAVALAQPGHGRVCRAWPAGR